MEEIAMMYEYLIRYAFGECARMEKFGARADIFRGLERASAQEPVDPYKLGFKMGEVTAHLCTALYEVQERHGENKEVASKIGTCIDYLLDDPTLEKVDKCIEEACAVLSI